MTDAPTIPWTILAGYRGSHAHGTYINPEQDPEFGTDDIDLMHVVVPPPDFYLGLNTYGRQGTLEIKDGPYDVVSYEVRKFVNLLCKGNPNVLSLLWLDGGKWGLTYPAHWGYAPGWALVRERDRFTQTQATISAFVGYAYAQQAAMRRDPTHRAYMGERRKGLAQRFGYDVKHAAHLVRLARMVYELVRTGTLVVRRPDADQIQGIKRGFWTLDQVLRDVEVHLEGVKHERKGLGWPDEVDREWASALCERVVRAEWDRRTA